MLKVFVGYDRRQPVAYHALAQSIMDNSSKPVSITPLLIDQLPIKRTGLTDFTFSRFLVPWLCDYKGVGIFLDSDMIVMDDLAKISNIDASVGFVDFQGSLSFERPSLMVFNCEKCLNLTPEFIDNESNELFDFKWAESASTISKDWNFLVGYQEQSGDEKLIHYTQGMPGYKECRGCDYSAEWFHYHDKANSHDSWLEVLGRSVHAKKVLERL